MTQRLEDTLMAYMQPAFPYKLSALATNNLTALKTSGGRIMSIQCANIAATPRYLKLYNKASAPVVASDVPVLVIEIPGNTAGAGNNINIAQGGIYFELGIAFAIVTGIADTDNTSPGVSEVIVNIQYK